MIGLGSLRGTCSGVKTRSTSFEEHVQEIQGDLDFIDFSMVQVIVWLRHVLPSDAKHLCRRPKRHPRHGHTCSQRPQRMPQGPNPLYPQCGPVLLGTFKSSRHPKPEHEVGTRARLPPLHYEPETAVEIFLLLSQARQRTDVHKSTHSRRW